MAGEGEDIDFGELLGLEEGQDLVIKKDGEVVKPVEAPKPAEEKPAPKPAEQKPATSGNTAAGKGKKGAKKGGKPVDLGAGQDEDEENAGGEMTEEERRKLEEKMKREDAKDAAALMGIDIKKSIDDVHLEDEDDFVNFAHLISLKVCTSAVRSNLVAFANQLLTDMAAELTSEDLNKIQAKLTVTFNAKLKDESGKEKKKGKTAGKPAQIKVDRGKKALVGYDMYEVDGYEGTDEYGGYDQVDFM